MKTSADFEELTHYLVWYVNFKISLLVDTVQSWPLIGRHVKGDLSGSSDVTVLEISLKLG